MKAFIICLWMFIGFAFGAGIMVPTVTSSILMSIIILYFSVFKL